MSEQITGAEARRQLEEMGVSVPSTLKADEVRQLLDEILSSSTEPDEGDFDGMGSSPRG